MMKKSKILININDLKEIQEYEKIGINNFLFAVEKFSIGYFSFALKDIPDNAYLFINRVMDTKTIEDFKKIIPKLKRFKGIIFEDLGVFHLLKDENIPLIWFQNHFTTNIDSINFYLNNGCTSAVISNEITKKEMLDILASADKSLVLNILGKNNIMYSRRKLLSNFNTYNNLSDYNDMILSTGKNNFLARESDYGTLIFNDEYFNYLPVLKEVNEEKIFMYLILNLDLKTQEIEEIINGKKFGNDGFLNKKTVYKMSEYDDKKK